MLKDVDNAYNLALLKIPKAVRQMNWLEVFSKSPPRWPAHPATKHVHPCHHFILVSPIMLFFLSFLSPALETPESPVEDNTKVRFCLVEWVSFFSRISSGVVFVWQREEEAAVLSNVMAEDYASLLKSVKKSTFTHFVLPVMTVWTGWSRLELIYVCDFIHLYSHSIKEKRRHQIQFGWGKHAQFKQEGNVWRRKSEVRTASSEQVTWCCSLFRGELPRSRQLHRNGRRCCRPASRTPPSDGPNSHASSPLSVILSSVPRNSFIHVVHV